MLESFIDEWVGMWVGVFLVQLTAIIAFESYKER